MKIKSLFIISTASLAASSFAQVTGTFSLDQSVLYGTNVGNGFVGLSHDNFTPTGGSTYSFMGFCTDLEIEANWQPTSYADTRTTTNSFYSLNQALTPNSQLGSEVSYIANHEGLTTNVDQATAAQLAIWEIQGISQSGVESYLGGTFSANVGTLASGYVATAETAYSNGARSTSPWYESPYTVDPAQQVTQNFVQPVPEPSTLALGVGLIGLALRRRSTRKS